MRYQLRRGGRIATLLLSVIVIGAGPALGQTPLAATAGTLSFQRTWGGAGFDRADGVAVAPDGTIYVVGSTPSFSVGGDFDVVLLRYASDGTLLFQKTYGTAGDESANGIAIAPDGSVYVAGSSADSKALVAKFTAGGTLVWQRTWGGTLGEVAAGIAVSGDGSSVYVAGTTRSFGAGFDDAFLLKFSASGALVWQRTWGGAINETGQAVAVAADGSVYVAGEGNSFFGNDAILLKFAADGALVWQRDWRAGTGQNDESAGAGVATAADGSVYLTGRALIDGLGQNAALVKFTPDGAIVWERTWGAGLDGALGVAVGSDGSIFITGDTASGSGGGDLFLVKFAPTGHVKDAKTWGGGGNESGQGLAVASDGAAYVAGFGSAPPYVFSKASTATKSPKGTSLGTPNGTVTDPGVAATRPRGAVTDVSGDHSTFGGGTDAALLKIAP